MCSILPITAEEAVWFPCGWKTPCVLYWVRRSLPSNLSNVKERNPITLDVFGEDKSLAQRGRKRITFTPLTADEIPNEGRSCVAEEDYEFSPCIDISSDEYSTDFIIFHTDQSRSEENLRFVISLSFEAFYL